MNEITKIHLGRQAFTVAVDAHKELQDYLRAIKRHMGDTDEAVEEVEIRMAELLMERGVQGDKVVLVKDVEYLKEQLGEPGDFGEEENEAKSEDATGQKRLFRDTDEAMIAGVAAGIGKYFGIDPLWVRLAFIALVFAGFSGVLIYIVLWLIVPEAKSKSDRLKMQGKPVTVDALKDVVERADVEGAARRAGNTVGKAVQSVLKVALGVMGLGLMLGGIATLLGLTTASVYWALNHDLVPGNIFPVGRSEVALLVLALVALAMIGLFFVVAGIAAIRRKWPLPGWVLGAIVAIFLATLGVGGALAADAAPKVHDRYQAAHHTYTRTVPEFSKLRVTGTFDSGVRYEESSRSAVLIKYWGDESDFSDIATEVKDQTLTVDVGALTERMRCRTVCIFRAPVVEVVILGPKLQEVVSDIEGTQLSLSGLHDQNLRVHAMGNSIMMSDVRADTVRAERRADGAWDFAFSGPGRDVTQPQVISVFQNTASIVAKNIDLKFEGTCDLEFGSDMDKKVTIDSAFEKLTLNGRLINSPRELRQLQDKPGMTAENCVYAEVPNITPDIYYSPDWKVYFNDSL